MRDLQGRRFGRWTVIQSAPRLHRHPYWLCQCDCGTVRSVDEYQLVTGGSRSCGCLRNEVTGLVHTIHGYHASRSYDLWCGMMGRCYCPTQPSYPNYGGRGIAVHGEWHNPDVFCAWVETTCSDPRLTLERIDVNGDYSPENCRWATRKEQANNKRNNVRVLFKGDTMTLAQLAEALHWNYGSLWSRMRRHGLADMGVTVLAH